MATQGRFEDRGRRRELLDRRRLRRFEIQDPQRAVDAGKRRSDVRDRGLRDLARGLAPWSVVELRIERNPPEPLAKPRRAAHRLARTLGPYPVGDPSSRGELPFDAARHHHRVDPSLETGDHDVLDRYVCDAAHVEGVGHREAVEAQLAAQKIGEDRTRDRGGRLGVERRVADVRAHHGGRARRESAFEWKELAAVERCPVGGDVGSREMRIERGVAVSGEMLRRRCDTRALRATHPRRCELRDALGVVAERARADHGVARFDVHVTDRRVVHRDPVRE